VLVSIGLDHTDILGPTIQHITREKAGIIKPKAAVVIGPSVPRDIVRPVCAKCPMDPLLWASRLGSIKPLSLSDLSFSLISLSPSLSLSDLSHSLSLYSLISLFIYLSFSLISFSLLVYLMCDSQIAQQLESPLTEIDQSFSNYEFENEAVRRECTADLPAHFNAVFL
jgi:hypothetical protein